MNFGLSLLTKNTGIAKLPSFKGSAPSKESKEKAGYVSGQVVKGAKGAAMATAGVAVAAGGVAAGAALNQPNVCMGSLFIGGKIVKQAAKDTFSAEKPDSASSSAEKTIVNSAKDDSSSESKPSGSSTSSEKK